MNDIKTAFVFGGQGAQKPGMGKDLCDAFPAFKAVFDRADRALGRPISRVCFEELRDENGCLELDKTRNCQPAVLTMGLACLGIVRGLGIRPCCAAGLSLGEYSALAASGALDFETALRLVEVRGALMDACCAGTPGVMSAITALSREKTEEACQMARSDGAGYVACANYNTEGQIVIGGGPAAVAAAEAYALKLGARRAARLNVGGAFHTELMRPAAEAFTAYLEAADIKETAFPVYANVTGEPYGAPDEIGPALIRHIYSPVEWERIMRRMIADGVTHVIELGCGRTLSAFFSRTDKGLKVFSAGDLSGFESVKAAFGG